METLAYLHIELADETPTDATDALSLESIKLFEWFKRQKLATHARIYLLSLVAILSILGVAGEALAQTYRQGDSGPEITLIQERLRDLGYFNRSSTGNFGSETRNAVIQFQRDQGLTVDGIVGQQTEAALFGSGRGIGIQTFSPLPPPPGSGFPPLAPIEEPIAFGTPIRPTVLQRGDRSPEVRRLQERLRAEGFDPGPIDGIFGEQTETALRRFQSFNGLQIDGRAGEKTLTALGLLREPKPNRYVVVIPGDENTLDQVNQVLQARVFQENEPRARIDESGRGRYVNAGAFPNRNSAESLSYLLRSRGLDARVVYFR